MALGLPDHQPPVGEEVARLGVRGEHCRVCQETRHPGQSRLDLPQPWLRNACIDVGGPGSTSNCVQRDMLSARRSFIGTYWPDLILPTTLADSGGSAEERTVTLSPLTDAEVTGVSLPPAPESSVAVSGSGFATERVGGQAPESEKMGTVERAVWPGMTPRAAGGEEAG